MFVFSVFCLPVVSLCSLPRRATRALSFVELAPDMTEGLEVVFRVLQLGKCSARGGVEVGCEGDCALRRGRDG